MLKKKKSSIRNQKGIVILETIPLIVVFISLLTYGVAMWASIHTSVLYSIAARTYSFETFRNRSSLVYFRESGSGLDLIQTYESIGYRFHGIRAPEGDGVTFAASKFPLSLSRDISSQTQNKRSSQNKIYNLEGRNREGLGINASPIWVTVGYGMCMNPYCGGEPE